MEERKLVYSRGNFLNVYEEGRFTIVDVKPAVVILPITNDGKLVMIEQYRKAVDQTILEFPAGKVDDGEDFLTAAKRELKEETGYTAREWHYIIEVFVSPGYTTEKFSMWCASSLTQGEQNLDEGERLNVIEIAPEILWDGIQAGYEKYNIDAKSYLLLLQWLLYTHKIDPN